MSVISAEDGDTASEPATTPPLYRSLFFQPPPADDADAAERDALVSAPRD